MDSRTYVRTDNLRKNSDHYQQGLCSDQELQFFISFIIFIAEPSYFHLPYQILVSWLGAKLKRSASLDGIFSEQTIVLIHA